MVNGTANASSENGGSVWESNPPRTFCAPRNGFEDREPHQGACRFRIQVQDKDTAFRCP